MTEVLAKSCNADQNLLPFGFAARGSSQRLAHAIGLSYSGIRGKPKGEETCHPSSLSPCQTESCRLPFSMIQPRLHGTAWSTPSSGIDATTVVVMSAAMPSFATLETRISRQDDACGIHFQFTNPRRFPVYQPPALSAWKKARLLRQLHESIAQCFVYQQSSNSSCPAR
jgi:hypothetical protein